MNNTIIYRKFNSVSRIKIQCCEKMVVNDVEFCEKKVMGNFLNPDKENSFITLAKRKNKYLFVDKTSFIEITNNRLNKDNRFLAVTRPRRFGKTVTAHMLLTYYSKGYAGSKIFDDLHIANRVDYLEHLNKYDVIYIDMNTIDGLFDDYSKQKNKVEGINDLVDYLEYSIINELKLNNEFSECLEKHQVENTGLLKALSTLRNHLNTQFIFIMDEWDLIYRDYLNDGVPPIS